MRLPSSLATSPYIIILHSATSSGQPLLIDLSNDHYYDLDSLLFRLLNECRKPAALHALKRRYAPDTLSQLVTNGLLVDSHALWEYHNVRRVEIETCTRCNWRCAYCPVRSDPKPKRSMDLRLFTEIIHKAARHAPIQLVTFHSYCEPTLDEHFDERVAILSKTRLKLDLYTNGSRLDADRLARLKQSQVINRIYFNLPTLDAAHFTRLTGSKSLRAVLRNIENAIECGFDIHISVVSNGNKRSDNDLSKIRKTFEPLLQHRVSPSLATDRAGVITNTYAQHVSLNDEYMFGCKTVTMQLHVSVSGDCFICCEDYHQTATYANIRDGEIDDVMNCDAAQTLRQFVFGGKVAPLDFICRRCVVMKQTAALVPRVLRCARFARAGVAEHPISATSAPRAGTAPFMVKA